MKRILLHAGCAALVAGLLGGCSQSRVIAASDGAAAPVTAAAADRNEPKDRGDHKEHPDLKEHQAGGLATTAIGDEIASVAVDDGDLGSVRGGFSTGSGVVVNFAFQEATYVNHSLTQSIVVPTLTVSPGSTTAIVGGVAVPTGSFPVSSVAANARGVTQLPVSSPALAIQSIVNSGMTSIISNVGGGGVSAVISNTANNQLVQQVITANIGITGLAQTIQQSVGASVMSRVQAATAQFR